jgi:hypothetical protein
MSAAAAMNEPATARRYTVPRLERELAPHVPEGPRWLHAIEASPRVTPHMKLEAAWILSRTNGGRGALEGMTYAALAALIDVSVRTVKRWFHRLRDLELIEVRPNYRKLDRAGRMPGDKPDPWNRANSMRTQLTERAMIKLGLIEGASPDELPERCPICEHGRRAEIEQRLQTDESEIAIAQRYHVQVRHVIAHANGHEIPPLPAPTKTSAPRPAAPSRPAASSPQSQATAPPARPAAVPPRASQPPPAPPAPRTLPAPDRPLRPVELELYYELGLHPELAAIATPAHAVEINRMRRAHERAIKETIEVLRSVARKGRGCSPAELLRLVDVFLPTQHEVKERKILLGRLLKSPIFEALVGEPANAERLWEEAQKAGHNLLTALAIVREAEATAPPRANKKALWRFLVDHLREKRDELPEAPAAADEDEDEVRRAALESLAGTTGPPE